MAKPVVDNLITSSFRQTGDLPISLQENSHQLYRTSNFNHNFNTDLNKSYDLNKFDEHTNASGGIKTNLEPLNKFMFDCTKWEKNTTRMLSTVENSDHLESDESLGILPDLLNDERTFDALKTGLGFSDDEVYDGIDFETNKSPEYMVFSPPVDNQFNRISLSLKNISTPLPDFGNNRRCSSTPKISVANTSDNIEKNSLSFISDEKEEPIIAGSCHMKFQTDFNLDDFKEVKPLTSTNKAFTPPQLSSIFNEMNEEPSLKSEVSFQEGSETIENNLNVMQILSGNTEKLFPWECEKNIKNMKVLNDTFEIKKSVSMESVNADVSHEDSTPNIIKIKQAKSNDCYEKEVKTLDSTFAVPEDEFNCKVDCEKTFVIDFNSPIDTEVSSESVYKNRKLNETHVLEADSVQSSSGQQEQIVNVTFTRDLDDDIQNSFYNNCYNFNGVVFKPLNPILEETFSRSDLNETKDHSKNVNNDKSQLASPDTFKMKRNVITYSENIDKILPEMNVVQNIYQIEDPSPNSLKAHGNIFYEQAKENIFHEKINFTEDEDDPSNKVPLSTILQSVVILKEDYSFEILPRSCNPCVNTTFSEKTYGAQSDINLLSIENNQIQTSQNPQKEMTSTTFSEEASEVQIEQNSIPNEENYQASPKEKTNAPAFKLADKDIDIQHKIHFLSQCDRDSVDETISSNLKKIDLKDALSKKATDECKSSLINCFLESNTIGKSRLLKPTKIIYPRKDSVQLNSQSSISKSLSEPINDNRAITFNKRLSLSSSASDDNKSKCKTNLKKPFEIPSKIGIKKPNSNYQKTKLDSKYPNGHLKSISTEDEKQNFIQPHLISDNNSKIKSSAVASANRKVSSRISLHEKLPMKSLKIKECRLNTTVAYDIEKSSNEFNSGSKILYLPRKEKLPEIGLNVGTGIFFSRHSIATNLPGKSPLFNNLSNSYNSKSTLTKQKSAPVTNSYKTDLPKVPGSAKLKFSALPKVQSYKKTSSDMHETKYIINKRLTSRNEKSNSHLKKPCIPEHKAAQFVNSQISTRNVKQRDNTRKSAGPNSSMFPPRELAAQPLNSLNVDKSNGNLRPIPKISKSSIRSMNSNNIHTVQQSELQNKVLWQTSGKIPQMRRIPAPRYNK